MEALRRERVHLFLKWLKARSPQSDFKVQWVDEVGWWRAQDHHNARHMYPPGDTGPALRVIYGPKGMDPFRAIAFIDPVSGYLYRAAQWYQPEYHNPICDLNNDSGYEYMHKEIEKKYRTDPILFFADTVKP